MCAILFQQSVPHTEQLGTEGKPYDAGPTGPMCAQDGFDEEGFNNLNTIVIQEWFAGVISDICVPCVRFEPHQKEPLGKISNPFQGSGIFADSIAEQFIDALNLFFEIEIEETTTIGELLEDWLDIKLAGATINSNVNANQFTQFF